MEYVFYGQLYPSFKRVLLEVKDPPLRFDFDSVIGKFKYTLLLNGTADIVVVVESQKEVTDLGTLLNLVIHFTQNFYDTALLTSGVLCSVVFSSIYLPNKSLAQVNIQDNSSWFPTKIFDFTTEILFELKNHPIVRIAITDIKNACIEPELTALFAFRAIETIMNSFNEKEIEDRKNNWSLLRENLKIERTFFNSVEEFSKLNRHGKPFEQTFTNRKLFIYSALIVLHRYMHYIKQGETELNEKVFPKISDIKDYGIELT